ncbi:NAD(P)-dependent alcohol dehydrogenase [Leucobacter komagatae]|uniref:NAD(P)-dependent alcohol dehydrogenase n=1 Tax=Leucobacter komagatae TaxID=55969 RepID=UPI0005ABC65F|nr:NAD(P)-dependent alcohol dehydrogenase [Leucobacter komagatae]
MVVSEDRFEKQLVSVLYSPKHLGYETRPVPVPGPGQVLIRVSAVGVCGSDVHYYNHGRIGDFVVEKPLVLGHEVSGVIAAVGDGVAAERIGSLVTLEPQVTNHWGEQSRQGRYNLDPEVEFFATPPFDGALCEYVLLPSQLAFDVPPVLSAEEAALIEPLAVAVASVRHARVGLGERVAVAGAGPIGLLAAQVARLAGAVDVVVSDPLQSARDRALRFGATSVLDPVGARESFRDSSFDVFIDASGVEAAIVAGVRALKPAGRAMLVGMGADTVSLPLGLLQVRELEVRGVFRYANAWPAAIDLAATGAVSLSELITARYGLDQVEEALQAAQRPGEVKVVVIPKGHCGQWAAEG